MPVAKSLRAAQTPSEVSASQPLTRRRSLSENHQLQNARTAQNRLAPERHGVPNRASAARLRLSNAASTPRDAVACAAGPPVSAPLADPLAHRRDGAEARAHGDGGWGLVRRSEAADEDDVGAVASRGCDAATATAEALNRQEALTYTWMSACRFWPVLGRGLSI